MASRARCAELLQTVRTSQAGSDAGSSLDEVHDVRYSSAHLRAGSSYGAAPRQGYIPKSQRAHDGGHGYGATEARREYARGGADYGGTPGAAYGYGETYARRDFEHAV